MSYTPTEWKTGDVITAPKLNNMENGIVGGQELFIIRATGVATEPGVYTTPVLDKTYNEIAAAIQQGKIPVIISETTSAGVSIFTRIPFSYFASEPANTILFDSTSYTLISAEYFLTNVMVAVSLSVCQSKYARAKIEPNSAG